MPRLKMPGVDDLTPEQDRILRLPDQGRYFVGGPPGTGKTVVALLRAHAMSARKNEPILLMHNLLLLKYCTQWLQSCALKVQANTWQRWFKSHYRKTYGAELPLLPAQGNGWQPYDWHQIETSIAAKPQHPHVAPVLIDEGQDLPRAFYQYLSLHFANIVVFADENQMIDEHENSTKENIWAELGIPPDNRYLLKTNHRNTLEVARVASHFYAGTDAGKPDLPSRKGSFPYLIDYDDQEHMVARAVRQARIRQHHLIGIMTANKDNWRDLHGVCERLCHAAKVHFMCYQAGQPVTVDFNRSGIVLLNMQSAKGLEFDSVLLPDLHAHFPFHNGQAHKMRLYVATSRATDRLFLLYNRTKECPLLQMLPPEDTLKRYSLKTEGVQP